MGDYMSLITHKHNERASMLSKVCTYLLFFFKCAYLRIDRCQVAWVLKSVMKWGMVVGKEAIKRMSKIQVGF